MNLAAGAFCRRREKNELNNLAYNRKMFDKAKVSVPKNLAELSATAAKLASDGASLTKVSGGGLRVQADATSFNLIGGFGGNSVG